MSELSLDNEVGNDVEIINIISSDNIKYELTRKELSLSMMITTAIDNDNNEKELIVQVPSKTLSKIVEWLKYHNGGIIEAIAKPVCCDDISNIVSEWDTKFIKGLTKREFIDITNYSNYLDIKSLLDICCAQVALMIKSRNIEEIQYIFSEEEMNKLVE